MTRAQTHTAHISAAGFHDEIRRLADEAAVDSLKQAEATKKLARRRPFNLFVSIGVSLIVLQSLLLAILYGMQHWQVAQKARPAMPVDTSTECRGVLHRTYWRVAAFMRDEGHPPTELGALLGKYVKKLPADPVTGKPLQYSTDGQRFTLRCPTP
jgi:hypothetical protein